MANTFFRPLTEAEIAALGMLFVGTTIQQYDSKICHRRTGEDPFMFFFEYMGFNKPLPVQGQPVC